MRSLIKKKVLSIAICFSLLGLCEVSIAGVPNKAVGPTSSSPSIAQPKAKTKVARTKSGNTINCHVDPAIVSLTIHKRSAESVQIEFLIRNLGTSNWTTGEKLAGIKFYSKNFNTRRVTQLYKPLPVFAAPNEDMLRVITDEIPKFVDLYEWGGELKLDITYTEAILSDGNRCNDDANRANNSLHLQHELWEFMRGPLSSKTFVP